MDQVWNFVVVEALRRLEQGGQRLEQMRCLLLFFEFLQQCHIGELENLALLVIEVQVHPIDQKYQLVVAIDA